MAEEEETKPGAIPVSALQMAIQIQKTVLVLICQCGGFCILGLCMRHQWRLLSVRKKRLRCLSWRIQLDFSKRGTIESSSSSISAATEVSCKG